jgi:hypothetical protein
LTGYLTILTRQKYRRVAVSHRIAVFFYRKGRKGFASFAKPLRKVAEGCGLSPQDP